MDNVKAIHGGITPKGQPVEQVVAVLEEALARAKSGELRSVALAGVCANHSVTTTWAHEDQIFALLGGLAYLQGRIEIVLENA